MNSITCVDPRTDPLWQKLLIKQESSLFHSPGWIKSLTTTYDFDVRAFVIATEAGEPVAGMPLSYISDPRGNRLVSLSFSDYCDPIVSNEEQWSQLSEQLVKVGWPIKLRCLHSEYPLLDNRFQEIKRAKWHGINLEPDIDTLWSNFHGSARRAIKKAERADVQIRIARDKNDLRAFFELHFGLRKYKYRLLAQPYRFFESIWEHLIADGQGELLIAVHQDRVIAGVLFLEWGDTIYYKFNASHPDYLSVRPNELVLWHGIQRAKDRGLTRFDFGLSDWDQEGLLRYKRKFATEEKTITFLEYEPAATEEQVHENINQLLPRLTDLFTDDLVPDHITEKAGELLYRYFT